MPKAHAELAVPRSELEDPWKRLAIREHLYRMLAKLGTVRPDSLRYERDPLNAPYADQGFPDDTTAVVRAVADVAPHH